jgi:hypothetical protein
MVDVSSQNATKTLGASADGGRPPEHQHSCRSNWEASPSTTSWKIMDRWIGLSVFLATMI